MKNQNFSLKTIFKRFAKIFGIWTFLKHCRAVYEAFHDIIFSSINSKSQNDPFLGGNFGWDFRKNCIILNSKHFFSSYFV